MNCPVCQQVVDENSRFCTHCGHPMQAPIPPVPTAPTQVTPMKFHSSYIFVVSLIFMILLAFALFGDMSSVTDLRELLVTYGASLTPNEEAQITWLSTLVSIEGVFNAILMGVSLTLMIFASSIKKKAAERFPKEDLIKKAKMQRLFAIILLAGFVVYFGFELYASRAINIVYQNLGIAAQDFTSVFFSTAVRIGLSIPMVIKSVSRLHRVETSYAY